MICSRLRHGKESSNASTRRSAMQRTLKALSYLVLGSMTAAVAYALYISVTYWSGIGV
jgi:hypothetical protein